MGGAMNTASQVVVALVLTMIVAFPLGVWVAESKRAARLTAMDMNIVAQTGDFTERERFAWWSRQISSSTTIGFSRRWR